MIMNVQDAKAFERREKKLEKAKEKSSDAEVVAAVSSIFHLLLLSDITLCFV